MNKITRVLALGLVVCGLPMLAGCDEYYRYPTAGSQINRELTVMARNEPQLMVQRVRVAGSYNHGAHVQNYRVVIAFNGNYNKASAAAQDAALYKFCSAVQRKAGTTLDRSVERTATVAFVVVQEKGDSPNYTDKSSKFLDDEVAIDTRGNTIPAEVTLPSDSPPCAVYKPTPPVKTGDINIGR